MEAQWIADRAALRCLSQQHPDWTQQEFAVCIGRSRRFVKQWLKGARPASTPVSRFARLMAAAKLAVAA